MNKLEAHIHTFPLIYLVKRSGNIGTQLESPKAVKDEVLSAEGASAIEKGVYKGVHCPDFTVMSIQ